MDEVQYRTYHDRIKKLTSLSNCREMYYELMENDNHNLRNVIGNLWTELREKGDQLAVSVISDFRKKTTEQFHPVDGMSAGEIEEMVSYYVQAKIIENDLDAQVENVIISGSRCRGIEKTARTWMWGKTIKEQSGKMIFLIYCMRMDSRLLEL